MPCPVTFVGGPGWAILTVLTLLLFYETPRWRVFWWCSFLLQPIGWILYFQVDRAEYFRYALEAHAMAALVVLPIRIWFLLVIDLRRLPTSQQLGDLFAGYNFLHDPIFGTLKGILVGLLYVAWHYEQPTHETALLATAILLGCWLFGLLLVRRFSWQWSASLRGLSHAYLTFGETAAGISCYVLGLVVATTCGALIQNGSWDTGIVIMTQLALFAVIIATVAIVQLFGPPTLWLLQRVSILNERLIASKLVPSSWKQHRQERLLALTQFI